MVIVQKLSGCEDMVNEQGVPALSVNTGIFSK